MTQQPREWTVRCTVCSHVHSWTAPQCLPVPPCPACVKAIRRKQSDVQSALDQCDEILGMVEDMPDAGMEYGESVAETVSGIQETIEKFDRVTDAQQRALDNLQDGVERWLRD